jgi:two-component system response regulator AlgR
VTAQPLHLLLVDDEAPARTRLKDLLSDIAAELPNVVVGEAADGIEALEFLAQPERPQVDLALVDIRMPRLDGIGLVQHLAGRENAAPVIFVTAYDQYAVQAFDLNAIDYLLKPVRAQRLLAALKKLPASLPSREALRSLAPQGRSHLHSTQRGRILLVPLNEILFLRAELKYVTARTHEREYLIEESLTHLEEEFTERFIRTHRNCLVARDAIIGVERDNAAEAENHWQVLLRGLGEKIPVSRRQWPQIKALLKEEGTT